MASLVLTSVTVLVGTAWTGTAPGPGNPTVSGTIDTPIDFTDHARSVTLNNSVAMVDMTTFGDGGFTSQKPGLFGADLTIDFNQDFAATEVDVTFGVGHLAGTLFYIDIKPTSAARGTTNPSYVYAAYATTNQPVSSEVGSRGAIAIPFAVTGKYARLTS